MKQLTFKFLFCRFEILLKNHFIQKLLCQNINKHTLP